jgi:hypothetical protein
MPTEPEMPLLAADFAAPEAMTAWIEAGLAALGGLRPSAELLRSVAAHEAPVGPPSGRLGRHGDASFRRFVAAAFLADLASYPAPVDQVDFARLLYVMHVFPRGFRVWSAEVPGFGRLPVGYTAWVPIAETSFERLEKQASTLRDRMVVPLPEVEEGGYLYLFNFSIVPALRGTEAARRLVKRYAEDVGAQGARGLAAITVSEDGMRVVGRFGLRRSGSLVIDGAEEFVYTRR